VSDLAFHVEICIAVAYFTSKIVARTFFISNSKILSGLFT